MREKKCERFGEILVTTDYSLFGFLKGNRKVSESHVLELAESMRKRHLISPLLVNENLEIIDGQHRYLAARMCNLPIYYIGVEHYGLEEVHILNSHSKNYKMEDFLAGYKNLSYPNYVKFAEFQESYPFLSTSMAMYYLNHYNKWGGNTRAFKEGKFEIKDYATACLYAERTIDFKQYAEEFFNNRNFNLALLKLYRHPKYNHQKMIQKLSYNSGMLKNQAKEKYFIENLCEIYNYKTREDEKIYGHELSRL